MDNAKGRNNLHHPHDAVFKKAMREVRVARELMEQHLPKAFIKTVRWDTLRLENASYVDEQLRQSHSDVVYSVKTTQGLAYVYVLCEHQTTAEKLMPLRILDYTVQR